MRGHSQRQLRVWNAWLAAQWNEPDRHDHYLMRLIAEVRRANAKNPRSVKEQDSKIVFTLRPSQPKVEQKPGQDHRLALEKQVWLSRMTKKVVMVTKPAPPST